MVLQSINENTSWIQTNWKCAFNMQWPNILFATRSLLKTFSNPEVLIGDKGAGSQRANPADKPPEKEMLVLRGESAIFKGKVSVNFHTKTNDVSITIPKSLGLPSDYKSLSIALGTFADSIELRMYAAK